MNNVKNKKRLAHMQTLSLYVLISVISTVCIMKKKKKSGMFIDEIYTYGLSNSHYAPFLSYVKSSGGGRK